MPALARTLPSRPQQARGGPPLERSHRGESECGERGTVSTRVVFYAGRTSALLLANTRAGPRAGATPASFGSRYSMRTRSTCSPSFRSDSAGGTKPVVRCFRPPRTDTELRAAPMTGQLLVN